MAKLSASEAQWWGGDRAIQIHGGLGAAIDLPHERWRRAMRTRCIGEETREYQRAIAALDLVGGDAGADLA